MRGKIEQSITAVMAWVEAHDYAAYDPGDGNLSFLHALTLNVLILERLLQQLVYRAPINLRPILGVRPHASTKGMGYMAWGYLKMYQVTRQESYLRRLRQGFAWLEENKSPGYPHYAWGNHFPFCTRSGKTPAFEPIVPWTALIGQAYLEAYETLQESRFLEVATSIGEWMLSLPRETTESGACISYVAFRQTSIHNSNMLAAAFLAQIGRLTANLAALSAAREAMVYSCSRMESDGSWYYGAAPKYHWIDNFHTGYNLDCLQRYITCTNDHEFRPILDRGYRYFKTHFFKEDGRPKYYHDQTLPTDIQCAAQAIDTLTFFADSDDEALALAQKVANWTIDHMQSQDGHFCYRDLGWAMNRTPMLHWGQGTMFKALAHLFGALAQPSRDSDPTVHSNRP